MKFLIDFHFRIKKISNGVCFDTVKQCPLCGRLFDKEECRKTLSEQIKEAGRPEECQICWPNRKYCGLWCGWLSQPSMVSTIRRSHGDKEIKRMIDYVNKKAKKPIVIIL